MSHWRDFVDPAASPGGYLPWKEVARRTSLSRTTAWRLQRRDEFPAPYAISPGRVGYREDEVEAWRRSCDRSSGFRRSVRRSPGERPDSGSRAAAWPQPDHEAAGVARSPRDRRTPPLASTTDLAASAPPLGVGDPSASRRPRRRRTPHAQAIAQQMMFDF